MPNTATTPWTAFRPLTLCMTLALSMALQGCAGSSGSLLTGAPTTSGNGTGGGGESSTGKTFIEVLGCVGGGLVGAALAKALANSEAKRLKLTPQQAAKRERGYLIGFALLGCGGGTVLAGTVYSKLSDSGKKARERELLAAAASAKPRTYRDPENPSLQGLVKPLPVYADAANKRECRDIEDTLADAGKGEPIVVKYCRSVPSGGWAPVTA
ncbi:hypothetical protein [Zoogloea sp.]|uniref:hypothetical protein n=1 Tax=Zoogloea sp. TaxID=49181 RepID=UPI0035B15B51